MVVCMPACVGLRGGHTNFCVLTLCDVFCRSRCGTSTVWTWQASVVSSAALPSRASPLHTNAGYPWSTRYWCCMSYAHQCSCSYSSSKTPNRKPPSTPCVSVPVCVCVLWCVSSQCASLTMVLPVHPALSSRGTASCLKPTTTNVCARLDVTSSHSL